MNDIFENTETMQENEHPRFYTVESVMRGHPDKLCDLIADSVLDACLQHDPASRVACEVMATHGHIIVAGEITTKVKPDVFNIVRDTLRDVGYDPKAYQIDCYIHDQSPDIAGAVEPELAEEEDEDTLGAGDQGVMVGYACNETPEYLPMPVVAAQRLVTLLEISRMTGVIPDIGPDGKVQVTMEYNGDTPVRITTVVVSVQHKEDTDINKLADLLDEYVFPLAFDGMPADDAEIILNPSGKFVQGGPDADTGLTGRKLMVDSYGTFAPHGGGAFSGKNATVMGDATVQDDAIVCGGVIMGKSCVCGYAVIRQDEQTLCAPTIDGSARVYGEISGNVVCRGNAVVLPGTKLDNRTQDCFVLEDDRVSVQTASRTPPPKESHTHDFER